MPRHAVAAMIAAALALAGCDRQMASQNKDKAWHAAEQPPNGLQWPLTPPDGMVTRDAAAPPPQLSLALLQRGQAR